MLAKRSTYWRALTGFRRRAATIVATQIVSGLVESFALAMIVPLLYAGGELADSDTRVTQVMERLGLGGNKGTYVVLGAFFVLGLLSVFLKFFAQIKSLRLRNDLEASLRKRMTTQLLKMKWSSFISLRLGDIQKSVLIEGSETAGGAQSFITALGNAAVVIVFIGVLLFISIKLTLITLSFAAITGIGFKWVGKKAEAQAKLQGEAAAGIADQISVMFGNLKFFRSTGVTNQSRQTVLDAYKRFADTYFKSQFYGTAMGGVFDSAAVILVGLILTVSVLAAGQLTPETVVFLGIFYRLVPQVMGVQDRFYRAQSLRPWFHSWEERMALATENVDQHAGTQEPRFDQTLAFDQVSFRFPGTDVDVLDDLSWSMRRGDCVAMVGESGVGKTTLLDLVTGLLTPTSGEIKVDGASLTSFELERWQARIGLVLQESPLFHLSALENIAWLDPEPDRERVRRCAELAHAASFIERLPQGFDTMIGEKGARLSGGQRQRIALARALYRDPWLLVLDEATSALDGESEAIVQEALESIKGMTSMLIVTHRIKTVEMADRIYVLEEGRIAQQGSWEELLTSEGPFKAMAARQGLALRTI